jgi:hypothetical protein
MARHSSILDFRRSLANRDGIQDLALSRSPTRSGARVPKVMLAAQVLQQATFEDAATLNEQTPVNGFGRHLHVRIAPKGPSSQPEICCGDHCCVSFCAMVRRSAGRVDSRHGCGRRLRRQACPSATAAR